MLRHYLDHASSSPLRPGALAAMLPYLRDHPGDPGRIHSEGLTTRVAIENAREQVAALVGARAREIVFTSCGTESINAAIFGALASRPGHVVTSAVEHSSVIESIARTGAQVTTVGVDSLGRYDAAEILASIRPDTTLVSVQLANHEVGTIQLVEAVAAGIADLGKSRPLIHIDACAALGQIPISFSTLGADLCSVTAHKAGGPKGAAALIVRSGVRVAPFIVGGAQERARRAGTENVAAIVGFGAAADEIDLSTLAALMGSYLDRLARGVLGIPGIIRHGDPSPDGHLPGLMCVSVEGVEAEPILVGLDQRGIAVHSGSACSSETLEPSPVLAAMGADAERSLRASFGWSSTAADVDAFLSAFAEVVVQLRSLGSR